MMRNGFTLIELIVVIILLGILAVTVAPKFINLQSDARAAIIQGVSASLKATTQLTYFKVQITQPAALSSSHYTSFDVDNDGVNDALVFGKPRSYNDGIGQLDNIDARWLGIGSKTTVCDSQDHAFCYMYTPSVTESGVTPTPSHFTIYLSHNSKVTDNCFAFYYQATTTGGEPQSGYTHESALNSGSITTGC